MKKLDKRTIRGLIRAEVRTMAAERLEQGNNGYVVLSTVPFDSGDDYRAHAEIANRELRRLVRQLRTGAAIGSLKRKRGAK